jgi:hypothetical protein
METITVGGRRYTDPDIISLIRATGQLIDPRSAVIHQARQLNSEYRAFSSQSEPFDRLKILASLRGLDVTEMDAQRSSREKRDAVLIPGSAPKRGLILYNPSRQRGRIAFSVAHEIAHTFFPNSVSGARFRTMCDPDSREGNELERLCDLAASEILMPVEEFVKARGETIGFHLIDQLTAIFGSSYESTVFRLATSYSGQAAAGLLRYRFNKVDQQSLLISERQKDLFQSSSSQISNSPSRKYRRQSFYSSERCGPDHVIPWNKSFAPSSTVYIAGRCTAVQRSIEALPNRINVPGNLESVRAPYQRERVDPLYGDVLFLWWKAN